MHVCMYVVVGKEREREERMLAAVKAEHHTLVPKSFLKSQSNFDVSLNIFYTFHRGHNEKSKNFK